jgi:hypothetical protein
VPGNPCALSRSFASRAASAPRTWNHIFETEVSRSPVWALRTPLARSASSRFLAASSVLNMPSDTAQRILPSSCRMK